MRKHNAFTPLEIRIPNRESGRFPEMHGETDVRQQHRSFLTGFTLIELLVVISIIMLLIAILVPALQKARNQARAAVCQARLKQWGPTLASYLDDNEGCFPCYRNRDDIWWFLRGAVVSIDDPNGQSVRPVDTSGIACCPMAIRRSSRTTFATISGGQRILEGRFGGAFEAWELTNPGRPFRASYGFNGWLFSHDFDASIPIHTRIFRLTGVNIDSITGRANIPAVLDSASPYSHPRVSSLPPRRTTGGGFGMNPFCSNRHGEHTNSLFLDWSVRRIGLKELWTLRWNLQFNTANAWTKAGGVLPEDWPEWMRKFKDY